MSRKPAVAPQIKALADQIRAIAKGIEAGAFIGVALIALPADGAPSTAIADPGPAKRSALIGGVSTLQHILNTTETNERMSALARRPDPANHA